MTSLRIAPTLELPVETVTETTGILGQRGAGKSNTAVVLAEEMWHAGLPWVAVDPKGDWWGVRSSADGKKPGLALPVFGGLHGDVPLEVGAGALVADLVVEQNLTAVLDVSDFTKADRARFLIDFFDRLYRRHRADPQPRHVFLEEAHEYIPQQVMAADARLKESAARIVLQGRSFGLGASVCSQRSARLHKDVLTQIGTLFAMRTTAPQDRKAILAWVEEHDLGRELVASLPELADGEGWIWSPRFLRTTVRVRFRQRATFDSGGTPVAGKVRAPATIADVDLAEIKEQMAATIEKRRAEDPKLLRRRITELERELAAVRAATQVEVVTETVEVPVVSEELLGRLDDSLAAWAMRSAQAIREQSDLVTEHVREIVRTAVGQPIANTSGTPTPATAGGPAPDRGQASSPSKASRQPTRVDARSGEVGTPSRVTGPQQKLLDALAWLESINVPARRTAVALVAGASSTSSAYANNLGALRTAGLIDYPSPGYVGLTSAGRALAVVPDDVPTEAELQETILSRVTGPQRAILRALIDAYPASVERFILADRIGASGSSSAYANNLGSLRTLGLLDYPQRGHVVATSALFLEGT